MSIFNLSTRNNPCPVCEDLKGHCRQKKSDPDYWLCMTYADAKKGEVIGAWKSLGPTKNQQWAQFKPDNSREWTEDKRREHEEENRRRREARAARQKETQKKSLKAQERHEQYTRLLAELTLHPDDRADLIRRGFTHTQIILSGFKSITRYQELQGQYSKLLPGVTGNAKNLIIPDEGYLCPIRNKDGLIVACQVRLRYPPTSETPRYKWLSGTENSAHLYPNDQQELPLPIFRPEGKPDGIALAEGTGAKPFLVSQRLNMFTIGAAGGQWASNPEHFREALDAGAAEYGKKEITIFPDAGDILNSQVMSRWQRVIALLGQWGWLVKVAWWGQVDKSHPDIDELKGFSNVRHISPDEFFGIEERRARRATESQTDMVKASGNSTSSFDDEELPVWLKNKMEKWRKGRAFNAQHVINPEGGWFKWGLPAENESLFARSGLGTGKTTQLRNWVRELNDDGWLFLGYRNTLLLQLCSDEEDILNGLSPLGIYHLHEHDGKIHVKNPKSKVTCCVNSLIHFQPEDFDGRNLVLDELMSVINYLHTSSTIKKADKVLSLFDEAIRRCKRVICLDGLLADWAVQYINSIAPGKSVITVRNIANKAKAKINMLMGVQVEEKVKKNDNSPWLKMLLEASEVPAICSDSQVFCETLDELLSDKGMRVLRIDSKTVSEKYVKKFLENCNKYLRENRPDVIIYSPSAESGLNVSIKEYFTHHFCFFFGVLGVDSIIQMIGRVRDTIPKHFWCRDWSSDEDDYGNSQTPADLFKEKASNLVLDMERTLQALPNDHEACIVLKQLIDRNIDAHFSVACKIEATAKFEKRNLRRCLIDALLAEKYEIIQHIEAPDNNIADEVKAMSSEIKLQNSEDVFNAEQIPVNLVTENSFDASWGKQCISANANLRKRLPGIETTELWSALLFYIVKYKEQKLLDNLELRWLLKHPAVALRMQQKKWSNKLQNRTEKVSLSRMKSQHEKVEALIKLNIEQYLEPDTVWAQDCPEFQETFRKGKSPDIISKIRVNPGKLSPAQYVGKLLGKIGYKWNNNQVRENGESKRVYSAANNSILDVNVILECISRKWGDYLEKSEALYWEPRPEITTSNSYTPFLAKGEKAEEDAIIDTPTKQDLDKLFKVQKFEGSFGSTKNEPAEAWIEGCKLVELPTQHQEGCIFESPSGERIISQNYSPMDESTKLARKFALEVIRRLSADIPAIDSVDEITTLYREVEVKHSDGLLPDNLLMKALDSMSKAFDWVDNNPNYTEQLAF